MFRKTPTSSQRAIFTSPESIYSGKALKIYEDQMGWHNQFRNQVTNRIDEDIFRVLFSEETGAPNSSARVLAAMLILKESTGISDQKLYEDCRFNSLTRSALGLFNAEDAVPTESTYYLFRKRIVEHTKSGKENLLEVLFSQVTKEQSIEFEVSGKRIRMDSKLLGSNIAWLSRYELIHETLRLFYKDVKPHGKIDKETESILDKLLETEGNKVTYICNSEEVKSRLEQLGGLIFKILPLFSIEESKHYQTLQRVFNEQYEVQSDLMVVPRAKEEISSKSVQSPHDTDCSYRNKGGEKVKGISVNITESCNEDGLNLIGNVDVRVASTPDVDFFQDDIKKAQEIFTEKTEAVHTDGAYYSSDNQKFCQDNGIKLYLHAIQGFQGRYQFNELENNELTVFDTMTNEVIPTTKVVCKDKGIKWRIKVKRGFRYFTEKEIIAYKIRKQIEQTPIEVLQKRNNVEATIFQLCYHYSNAKSRYRGLIKHQMWANVRCLWVNFVRILKYVKKLYKNTSILSKYQLESQFILLNCLIITFLTKIMPKNLSYSQNPGFSTL